MRSHINLIPTLVIFHYYYHLGFMLTSNGSNRSSNNIQKYELYGDTKNYDVDRRKYKKDWKREPFYERMLLLLEAILLLFYIHQQYKKSIWGAFWFWLECLKLIFIQMEKFNFENIYPSLWRRICNVIFRWCHKCLCMVLCYWRESGYVKK